MSEKPLLECNYCHLQVYWVGKDGLCAQCMADDEHDRLAVENAWDGCRDE